MDYQNNLAYAKNLDIEDPLRLYRDKFYIPKQKNGKDHIYLCGNSLGLQPRSTRKYIEQELNDWEKLGVEGHFEAKNPWMSYHEILTDKMSKIVGAKANEVVVMNSLTVNLHLMMVSFYRPSSKRYKILIEGNAFPSDQYAVKSQIEFHGYDVADALIELIPRKGEKTMRIEDILKLIKEEGDTIVLIMIGGLNYYTGQAFDMKAITKAGHEKGCFVGFDLAHGAGNLPLQLHDWQVDFAVWCTYKYLNSGPGGVAGCFVHENHVKDSTIKRFTGWWGHEKATRFLMDDTFVPIESAEGWQLSNAPILSMAALHASLDIFEKVGMKAIQNKAENLTGYLEYLLIELQHDAIEIITPKNAAGRGSQLSIQVKNSDKSLFKKITKKGVIADWREPDVIRVAPIPLYNSYADVFSFVAILKECLNQ
ncbi:MAG: kynureninase [Flavobacteriaceae bacterium]|nr:kynureninase [Flavobacteriaceae bacterium]